MEELLTGWYDNTTFPVLSAFILGLMTAISPCPMATNITAIGFIGRDIEYKNRVFIGGLVYTAGRAFSYTLLAAIIYIGADQMSISGFFQRYGEKILGPLLIIIGVLMLNIIRIRFPGFTKWSEKLQQRGVAGYGDVFLLGVVFALAFCPYSGVLYFGMLIPMTLGSSSALLLPLVFAIATGIPVIIIAWLLAYTVSGVGKFYDRIRSFEYWFRRVVAVLFIMVGLYYMWEVYL